MDNGVLWEFYEGVEELWKGVGEWLEWLEMRVLEWL